MIMFVVTVLCAMATDGTAAAEKYERAQFDLAVSEYTALIEKHEGVPDLYYNRGNTFFRDGKLGEAIADYRRGLFLSPSDADIKSNLAHARGQVKDAVLPPNPSVFWRTVAFWHFGLSHKAVTVVMLLSNVCFWVFVGIRRSKPNLRGLRFFVLSSAIVTVGSAGSWVKQTWWPVEIGVVTAAELSVFAGVHESAVVRFVLHEGVEVLVLEESAPWVQIAIDNGERGWVSTEAIEIVESK